MRIRILSGELRGREIQVPARAGLRPTADKVRKAVSDLFRALWPGARVLDLFSGTGALGFEAISAGAAEVFFVESDARSCKTIRENLVGLGVVSRGKVLHSDAPEAIRRLTDKEERFDLVLMDPPYASPDGLAALASAGRGNLLADDGWLLWECARRQPLPPATGSLRLERQKEYGDTKLALYRAGTEGGSDG